ncbi:MAG: hypothetical protein EOP52_13195 [Sphingobacteriales bacterium]|nr:MAG: hypothetical protein EOP52_13195 [Sphingobacteriales bacterium]
MINSSSFLDLTSPCHCGSGNSYVICHYRRDNVLQRGIQIFQKKKNEEEAFIEKYGHIRKPQMIRMGDRHVVAIGNQIFTQTNPGPYNFVNAVHDYTLHIFGDDFLAKQESLPYEKRHPAIQWLHTWTDKHNATLQKGDVQDADLLIGYGAAWLRLGYDLYTIRDNAELTKEMHRRILNEETFQAARHELFVAALFVAAGFEIKFEDEKNNKSKHVEFIATDKLNGMQVAVEAKSRRRQGVKGFKGGNSFNTDKVGVRSLVTDAYLKENKLPLYIFIDANLPSASLEKQQTWLKEIDDMMNDLANEGYINPCPAHAVFFHNDPSHYIPGLISHETDNLWIKHYTDKNHQKVVPEKIVERLMLASNQRIAPPDIIPDF